MKFSNLIIRTEKNPPKGEVSINAQLLQKAGFIDKLTSGIYTFLPLGLKVLKKIENIIREEMNLLGSQEILMPALHPKQYWETTNRWNTMDDLYKLKDNLNREFALGPTHEEIIVPLIKKFVQSYKDFPFSFYQIQTKFRSELRAKSGLLRGREFIMKDLYSFHLTEESLDEFYEKVKESYFKIFNRLGIGENTYFTFASGGSFSKFSHEFQTISEAGEDIIFICQKCQNAINKEIKNEIKNCPNCGGKKFEKAKSIEVGNIFKLKDKFTKPFNFYIKDKDGKEKIVLMGCYGIGLNRCMGTIVEKNHDKYGIIWPNTVAPFDIYLISIDNPKKGEDIYKKLSQNGFEVLYDDREESVGIKFVDADLLGIPLRLVINKKLDQQGKIEIKIRKTGEIKIVNQKDSLKVLKDLLKY